jgi:hypothetical protein
MRLQRLWQEREEAYSKRCFRTTTALKTEHKWADLDAITVKRQYTFIGHIIRFAKDNPDSIMAHVIDYISADNNGRDRGKLVRQKQVVLNISENSQCRAQENEGEELRKMWDADAGGGTTAWEQFKEEVDSAILLRQSRYGL